MLLLDGYAAGAVRRTMDRNKKKLRMRLRRHYHIRKKLEGTAERPRLSVFRSNAHIYAQVIDDRNAATLVSISTLSPEVRDTIERCGNIEAAAKAGSMLGDRCLEKGIEKMVFDRGGYKYHGRVKALAEGVREVFKNAGKEVF